MKRLCRDFRIIDTGHGGVRIFMPGIVYDIKEFKDGQALVNGIWAPDYIFDEREIKELSI